MSRQNKFAYHFRQARREETDAILALFAEEVKAGRMLPRDRGKVEQGITNWRVAEKNGQIIGCVSLVVFNQELCEVRSLAVSPEFRGNGLGKELIAAALGLAEERSIPKVLTLTRSPGLFEQLGFRRDTIQNYPEKVWKDCLPCPLIDHCDETALIYTFPDHA